MASWKWAGVILPEEQLGNILDVGQMAYIYQHGVCMVRSGRGISHQPWLEIGQTLPAFLPTYDGYHNGPTIEPSRLTQHFDLEA